MDTNVAGRDFAGAININALVSALRLIEENTLLEATSGNKGTSVITNEDGQLLHQDRNMVSKVLDEICNYLQQIGILEGNGLERGYRELLKRIAFLETAQLLNPNTNAQSIRDNLIADLPFLGMFDSSLYHFLQQLSSSLILLRDIVINELMELVVFKKAGINPDLCANILADVSMKAALIVELELLDYTREQ